MPKQNSLKTFLYKACPRCQGDLALDFDMEQRLTPHEELQYVCLQCGRRASILPERSNRPVGAARAA